MKEGIAKRAVAGRRRAPRGSESPAPHRIDLHYCLFGVGFCHRRRTTLSVQGEPGISGRAAYLLAVRRRYSFWRSFMSSHTVRFSCGLRSR